MKALIVDDDRTLADVVAFTLRREGYEVILAYDGETALDRWENETPDIIVLDVNLPKLDGFSVCRRIREYDDTPILLLTVRGEEDDIIQGLNLGADDYITKPFSPRQLVARAEAVLRRSGATQAATYRQVGRLCYDPNRREVTLGQSEPVSLTRLESRLLDCLMINAGQVMTTDTLIDHIWGPHGGNREMLRQLVRRLRRKIEPDSTQPTYIETVPGLGYGFIDPDR
jgi:DNA-binding response OmpR family regulator